MFSNSPLLLAFLPINLFSQQSYDITFKIRDIYDNKIVIKSYYGKDIVIIDTVKQAEDGSFRLLKDNINSGIGIVSVGRYDIFTFLFSIKQISLILKWMVIGTMWLMVVWITIYTSNFKKANTSIRKLEGSIRKEIKENKNANKDSLESIFLKESKSFVSFQNQFYENYPNHLMSKLVNVFEDIKVPAEYLIDKKLDTSKLKKNLLIIIGLIIGISLIFPTKDLLNAIFL